MESFLSLWRLRWDHEPTPNPSQEGNGQDADESLLPLARLVDSYRLALAGTNRTRTNACSPLGRGRGWGGSGRGLILAAT